MLRVAWFDNVTADVEGAVRMLPECESCPHETYLEILQASLGFATRIAVVADDSGPAAVIALVRRSRLVWEPLGNWLFPGPEFPARDGMYVEALKALRLETPVAWWRMAEAPPRGDRIDHLSIEPVYRQDDLAQREAYWRNTNYFRHIRAARNRTSKLEVRVGIPEFAEQIAAGWRTKWTASPAGDPEVRNRGILARALEPLGRHVTIGLFDNGRLAAGCTNFVHRGALVAGVLYVPEAYRALSAGVRLIDLAFEEGARRGLSGFDLGGGADYKLKWAPPVGERARFTVAGAAHVRLLRGLAGMAKRVLRRGNAADSAPAIADG